MADGFTFAVPGDPGLPTGGYGYGRRIALELTELGLRVTPLRLPEGFPFPDAAAIAEAGRLLAEVPAGETVLVDGLALGVLPEAAAAVARRGRLVALVHHPLAHETGHSAETAARLAASERAALAHADAVVATGPGTARSLAAEYGVAPGRITLAPPGTDPAPPAIPSDDGPVRLLAVGSLIPRKGHDDLIAALAGLADLDWRLDIVGSATLDRGHAATLAQRIEASGLADRIRLTGAIPAEAVAARYRAADLFVLASRYEGWGMAYTEALAHGLPVVGTGEAVMAEAVRQAAVLVPAGDRPALAAALRGLLADPDARRARSAAAQAAARLLPTWRETALAVARVIGRPT
ncbi:glycosyltransferase family 4 protein [Prosthecodimorpha staleyi]|uniref:glycosyltransferase family 4 protein n=1 Tax=Prosthecodimorpha staleyi TaxID=2840188 RepID=UPI0021C44405|nr:glycosyltransferase family 4 protein [Prosthecodimorpha staleyi]